MSLVTIYQNPQTTDSIIIPLATPDANGCFLGNPYKVGNLTILYIDRNYALGGTREYDVVVTGTPTLEQAAATAAQLACVNPTSANIAAAQFAQTQLQNSQVTTPTYFNQAITILSLGDDDNPVWLSSNTADALITNIPTDTNGNPQYGQFQFTWTPLGGTRAGDYIVCWTWTPIIAGSDLSASLEFYLAGDPRDNVSIPSHVTVPGKYQMLFDRYIPDSPYKSQLCTGDLTYQTLTSINNSFANVFTSIEDQVNQIIDLYNANVISEPLIMYLSNTLGKDLRSSDPTLWRRQTRNAIPRYKQKGTLPGLTGALDEADITLNSITRLWQAVSPFTWQDDFIVTDTDQFQLTKVAVLPTNNNYQLWLRPFDSTNYIPLTLDYVSFSTVDGITTMTWEGNEKSVNLLPLMECDELLIKYVYNAVTNQSLEDYIINLPLSDQRDSRNLNCPNPPYVCPLKNWNVRLIAEDDPLFNMVIPTRHPFAEPVVFGYVRTEFPWSENVYNMDEYNGSLRESTSPCDIDCTFLDPCGACLSSKVNVDVDIKDISSSRIQEAQQIITEYSPFHMSVFNLNINGKVEDFVPAPNDDIQILITYSTTQYVIAGNANAFFHRVRVGGDSINAITRSMLATSNVIVSGTTATAYNTNIVIYDATYDFRVVGIDLGANTLTILAPSPNAGTYAITAINKNTLVVSGLPEPLNTSAFTYNIINQVLTISNTSVTRDDVFIFLDANNDFSLFGTQTLKEGASWLLSIPAYSISPYSIQDVLPNGQLILENNGTLPGSSVGNISYTLYTNLNVEIVSSNTGRVNVINMALVVVNDPNFEEPNGSLISVLKVGDSVSISGNSYAITEFVAANQFYIINYAGSNLNGFSFNIFRTIINSSIGVAAYQGTMLQTIANYESSLNIMDGANPPSDPNDIIENDTFKENYLIVINGNYYKVQQWNGVDLTLNGPMATWTTLGHGGTSVTFEMLQFTKPQIIVDAETPNPDLDPAPHNFLRIDRRGNDMVSALLPQETVSFIAMGFAGGSNINEIAGQQEGISITIERRDGSRVERKL